MGGLKLFEVEKDKVTELTGQSVGLEKSLQGAIEKNLETFLGIRFLDSEHYTGREHGGRIDTLGIDENDTPVILEYKRTLNANVINQGLFYLNWLLDHKAEFELLVMKKIGKEVAENISWDNPRLVCIAGDFSKFDQHAVQQMNRNIDLVRYKRFGENLLLLEQVNASLQEAPTEEGATNASENLVNRKGAAEFLNSADSELTDIFESLKAYALALGDDVQLKSTKFYFVFKRLKNFACVEIRPQIRKILVFVKLDPKKIALEKDFLRDVTHIGHYGNGDVEIAIKSIKDLERAKPFILLSYEAN